MHDHTEQRYRYTTDIKRQLAPIDLSLSPNLTIYVHSHQLNL